jgi:hypothetical protein
MAMTQDPRSKIYQHAVNFYKWMLVCSLRSDALQEIELAICTLPSSPTDSEINQAQRLLSQRLNQLAKDAGYRKSNPGGWVPRFVGRSLTAEQQ